MASGLSTEVEDKQMTTLVYSMGVKAEDIFQSFGLSEEELKSYSTVKAKLKCQTIKCQTIKCEEAKFNRKGRVGGQLHNGTLNKLVSNTYN